MPAEHPGPHDSQPPRSTQPPPVTPSRVIAGVCLIIPFVALLWVNSYSRLTPEFIGIPFFYWYQVMWVPATVVLTSVAYVLVRRDERARKGGAGR